MTDTPRTDVVQAKQIYSGGYAEMAEHARQLERENARLRAVAEAVVAWYENAGNEDPGRVEPGTG